MFSRNAVRPRISIQVVALVAAVIIGGSLAWTYHVRSVAALLDARAAAARSLLATSPDPGQVAEALGSGDVRVVLGPPPGGPPQPGGPRPRPGSRRAPDWFSRMIADLAHIRPRIVATDAMPITLVPSAQALARWFLVDLAICVAAIAIVFVTAWRSYGIAASAVERSLTERAAAAAEFQRFLADAGHELRTPLTILSGYIDVLGGYEQDEVHARVLRGMRAAAARMRGLVEKMLLLSRLESTGAKTSVVSVAAVSDEVAQAMRAQAPDREIAVDCDPRATICMDEDDLYEAQRNLVENALRYAPQSPVAITAAVRDSVVEVAVSDRGPGIPLDEQALVFERFYRGRDQTGAGGTGLGLAIVRRVVERWHGTVALESSDRGTRVVLRFPQAQSA